MPGKMNASRILDRCFLDMRHRILDLAAALDRVERAGGVDPARADARVAAIHEAIRLLTDGRPDRAERVQMVFSDPYEENWRTAGPR